MIVKINRHKHIFFSYLIISIPIHSYALEDISLPEVIRQDQRLNELKKQLLEQDGFVAQIDER